MRPAFVTLLNRYPGSETRAALYRQIGWDDVIDHPAYKDTCAIRMSVALLRAGVVIGGASSPVKAGPMKGLTIEIGQVRLSRALKRIWGAPEVFKGQKAAEAGIGDRRGVVSFFRIRQFEIQTNGGHIDLVYPTGNGFRDCERSCFFDSVEVWFWPLK